MVDELRRQGKLDRSLLWAQSERAVRRYAELAGDETEVALLRDAFTADEIDRFLGDAVDFGATAISAHQDTVDDAFIERAHGLGLRVHCWFQDLAHPGAPRHAAARRHRHRLARRRPREEPP